MDVKGILGSYVIKNVGGKLASRHTNPLNMAPSLRYPLQFALKMRFQKLSTLSAARIGSHETWNYLRSCLQM